VCNRVGPNIILLYFALAANGGLHMTSRRFRSSCPIAVVVLLLALLIPPLTTASSGKCRLVRSLRDEIASYRPVVERVLSYVQDKNGYKGRTWAALSEFTDTFGSRLAGTSNLENSIDYMMNSLRADNLDNVHGERVMFTGWQRYITYIIHRVINQTVFGS